MKIISLAAFNTFTPEMSVSDISGDMTPVLSTNRSPYFICRVILCSLFNLEGESSAAAMTDCAHHQTVLASSWTESCVKCKRFKAFLL